MRFIGFAKNPDNKFQRIDNFESAKESEEPGHTGRSVFCLQANVENLPFPDNTFNSIISNLCLQITPNHTKMLEECYRCLVSGGKAAFSVWGREENTTFVTFLPEILKKYGVTEEPEKYCNFHLNDKEKLLQDAKNAGFTNVKAFFTPSNYAIFNGK